MMPGSVVNVHIQKKEKTVSPKKNPKGRNSAVDQESIMKELMFENIYMLFGKNLTKRQLY